MSEIIFSFFAEKVLFFIIMLYYIRITVYDVSIFNNIYNIIHFSREVKKNFE